MPYERPEPNTRLKAYIVEVRKTAKGPQIVVSRTHPGLIKRLFELEVPEIADGVVEIKACAREPGHRTKIAVWSNDPNVDPVGACVGARGARVRMVVNELRGEKIDIVPFSEDPPDFVAKALSPAKVKEVRIDEDDRHRRGHRPRLPALAGHRQGGPERPPRRPPHRLARRHQERDPARRGGGLPAARTGPQGEWVIDPTTGEQVWQPADGGEAMSAEAVEPAATAPRPSRRRRRRARCRRGRGRRGRGRPTRPTEPAGPTDVAEVEPEPAAEEPAMHVEAEPSRRRPTPADDPAERRRGRGDRRPPA